MSIFAAPMPLGDKRRKPWWLLALGVSFTLHALAGVAYLWTPEYDFTPPPQGAAIVVTVAAPLAAPIERNDSEQLDEQVQPEVMQAARKQSVAATEPVVEPEVVPEVPVVESKQQAEFKAPVKKKVEKKIALSKPKPKPEPEIEKVEIEKPEEQQAAPEQVAVIQQAASPKSIQAEKQSKRIQTEQLGIKGALDAARVKVTWQQALHAQLENAKRYPPKARRLRKQGMPVIQFTMDRQGQVLQVNLVKSSGVEALDKEALDLIFRAAPLVKPPDSVAGMQLALTVPINFSF